MRKHNPHQLQIWIPHPCDSRCDEKLPQIRRRGSMMRIPTAWRALCYMVFLTILVLASVLYTLNWERGDVLQGFKTGAGGRVWDWESGSGRIEEGEEISTDVHPIARLMSVAEKQFNTMLKDETHSLDAAAERYRKKRRRHPPPGFDAWYHYAVEQGAVVIEEFWDQIYDDLAPFWSIEPLLLRKQTHAFTPKISIRDGKSETHTKNMDPKLDLWADVLRALASHPHVRLPNMDIPFNVNDQSVMLVPWEIVDSALSLARPMMPDAVDVISEYSGLEDIDKLRADVAFDPEWIGFQPTSPNSQFQSQPLWSLIRPACPPQSLARTTPVFDDIWIDGDAREDHSATALLPMELPEGSLKGYLKNWTKATDACEQPNLQGLHGAFLAPSQMNLTMKLFPLFGDTKFSMGNEILVPGASEWNETPSTSEPSDISWDDLECKLFWRGSAGHILARYWQHSHRHRFVSMLNATHVEIAEASIHSGNESTVGVGYAKTFRLLPANEYHLKSQTSGHLAEWVNEWADAAFTGSHCDDGVERKGCVYLDEFFSVVEPSPTERDGAFKYAAVVDGGSGDNRGEFIQNMNSGKVTLRATIRRNWYDSRLIPWLHFVPMDNTFVDLYGIMEYFVGANINEEAKDFPHAVGEVQKHEHHFNTPGSETKEKSAEIDQTEKQGGMQDHEHHSSGAPSHDPSHHTSSNPHVSGISNYSLRKRGSDGHDAMAQKIAEASRDWAGKVLRREDMLVYVYRLLLEYARIVDDKRDRLGWVSDLVKD